MREACAGAPTERAPRAVLWTTTPPGDAASVAPVTSPVVLPPWPVPPPAHGSVILREFLDGDAEVGRELSRDPYVPLVSTLPPDATEDQGRDWVERNRERWSAGKGFSFAIADATTGHGLGQI